MDQMLNGDWRIKKFIHIERGCCPGGIVRIRENYVAALLEGAGVSMHESGRPPEARWGSMSEANSEYLLGNMPHGAFGRLFVRTFDEVYLRSYFCHARFPCA